MARLMRALAYDTYVNGAVRLKHVDVPVPSPSKDEVVIKIEAVSINQVDWKGYKLRTMLRPLLTNNSVSIPCTDVSGEVVEVGSAVNKFKLGDKVVAILNIYIGGGLSEYGVAKESVTVLRPVEVSAAEGAGLPIAGLTAHVTLTGIAGLKLEKSEPQRNILVTGASGGVGLYTVQLAKLGNNHVTATCGAHNFDLVKSLGADEVLDYKTEEGASLRSPSGRKYDVVIHCAPTPVPWPACKANLGEHGLVVDPSPGPSSMFNYAVTKLTRSNKKLHPFILFTKDDVGLKYLVGLIRMGSLKRSSIPTIHSAKGKKLGVEALMVTQRGRSS